MKPNTNKYTKEVEEILHLLSIKNNKEQALKLKKYIGTNLNVLGITSKEQNNAYKSGFTFHNSDNEKTFLVYNEIYKQSNLFEAKNLAFIYLDKNYQNISAKTQLKLLPHWVKQVDNWAHSDSLSKFLTRLLAEESTSEKMFDYLKKWNSSKNLWERRQSLVALYYYARTKKTHVSFNLSIELLTPLINDKEYFVQKAVGWTLRESYNVYPKQTFGFINENIKDISPVAFTTCIEKMTDKQKQTLKQKRKK